MANLGSRGSAVWTHSTSENVKSVAIAIDGQAIVFGTDKAIGCLDSGGRLRWRFAVDVPIEYLHVGIDRIVGAGSHGAVYCLDVELGECLVSHDSGEDVHGLAISGSGILKFLTIATGNMLRMLRLDPLGGFVFVPILEDRSGIADALRAYAPNEVRELHLSARGSCIVVELERDYACYTLEGDHLWRCRSVDPEFLQRLPDLPPVKPPVKPPPPQPEPPTPGPIPVDPWEQEVTRLKRQFIVHVRQMDLLKAPKLRTRSNVRFGTDVLDVYFDGRGYLFVGKATDETLSRATRLAQETDIYIIASRATDNIIRTVKGIKSVEIFRLNDMVKTSGGFLGGKNEFEKFMESTHHRQFRRQ